MPERPKHIGVDSFFAERSGLLNAYSKAKKQTADDAVKTEHGNVAEALARKWLQSFLPKRFGVCKGYIITTNLNFEGPLEEWDVLVYDAIESPVLFTRASDADAEPRRAIPVEYVRAVIEIKATLTPVTARKCASKLLKLHQFIGENGEDNYPQFLCEPFLCAALFFETRVDTLAEYRQALDALTELYQHDPIIPLMGGLVLQSQRHPEHSGYLRLMCGDDPISMPDVFEMSSPFNLIDGKHAIFGAMGWGVNFYPMFLFDFLASIRGTRTMRASSFYGLDFEAPQQNLWVKSGLSGTGL